MKQYTFQKKKAANRSNGEAVAETIQRAPAPTTTTPSAKKEKPAADPFSQLVYDQLKDALGEKELKEYAKKIAEKGSDFLKEQMVGVTNEKDFLAKAQIGLISEFFKQEVERGANDLFASPKVQAIKDKLLAIVHDSPVAALGLVLAGLAAAYLADAPLAKEKEFNDVLTKGLDAKVAADFGSFQSIAVKQLGASISYTHDYFKLLAKGEYKEGKPFTAGGSARVGTKEINAQVDAEANTDGQFKLKLGNVMNFRNWGLTAGASYDSSTQQPWTGYGTFRIGDPKENRYFTTAFQVHPVDGNIDFKVNPQLIFGRFNIGSSFSSDTKPSDPNNKDSVPKTTNIGGISGGYKNGLEVTAGLNYNFTDSVLMPQVNLGYTSPQRTKDDKPQPFIYIRGGLSGGVPLSGAALPLPTDTTGTNKFVPLAGTFVIGGAF